MSNTRKTEISFQLFHTLQFLSEADAVMPQQTPQAVANSNPMQPLPGQGQPQQQVVGSSGGEPISTTGEPLSLDTIINRLNIIRGGRSFSEPEVYGQLTTLYKSLSDQDKTSLDRVLTEIGKIVVQQAPEEPTGGQAQGTTAAQPPPGGAMGRGAAQQPGAAQATANVAPMGSAGPTAAMA